MVVRRKYEGTRMFHVVTRTWNPIIGCLHNCVYCWSRRLVETRLVKTTKKYRGGFSPRFFPEELNVEFRDGEFVFVSDMGDMFGDWVPEEWIRAVFEVVRRYPTTTFLFLTKNPRRYWVLYKFLSRFRNAVFGATIETDDDGLYLGYGISDAPPPSERIHYMKYVKLLRRMVSVEPIIDFTDRFWEHIVEIEPEFVYVGYDNYRNRLPEPTLDRTQELIDILRQHGITVYEKTIREAWYEKHRKTS